MAGHQHKLCTLFDRFMANDYKRSMTSPPLKSKTKRRFVRKCQTENTIAAIIGNRVKVAKTPLFLLRRYAALDEINKRAFEKKLRETDLSTGKGLPIPANIDFHTGAYWSKFNQMLFMETSPYFVEDNMIFSSDQTFQNNHFELYTHIPIFPICNLICEFAAGRYPKDVCETCSIKFASDKICVECKSPYHEACIPGEKCNAYLNLDDYYYDRRIGECQSCGELCGNCRKLVLLTCDKCHREFNPLYHFYETCFYCNLIRGSCCGKMAHNGNHYACRRTWLCDARANAI